MIEWITQIDTAVLYGIQNLFCSDFMNGFMIFWTKLGDGGFVWIALGIVLLLIPKTRRWGLLLLLSLALAALLGNGIIKPLVGRLRPCDVQTGIDLLIPHPGKSSFPSGHTISAFASATALFLQNKKWGACALTAASLIGFSRLYFFVHYPTDVLTGAVLGILTAVAVKVFMDRRFPALFAGGTKEVKNQ